MTMSSRIRSLTWIVPALALALAAGAQAASLKAGDAFPVMKESGATGSLPALDGRVVLVDFWASWCGPCKASFPVLDKIYRRYKDDGFVVVAVSVDQDPEDMTQFLEDHPVSFAVVHDARQKLVERAGIESMPTSFLLDKGGRIVAVHNGFKGAETENQLVSEIEGLLE
jgi:thiol-disulfide isomerase/thioredoxin